jgi:hypothetical protein
LATARIENLHLCWVRSRLHLFAFAIENDDDVHAGPILIIAQLLEQRFTGQRRPARMKFAQLRPGKNNAVPVDD